MKKTIFAMVCVLVMGLAGCGPARYDSSKPESVAALLKGESEITQRQIMFLMMWFGKEEKEQFNGMTAKELVEWGDNKLAKDKK